MNEKKIDMQTLLEEISGNYSISPLIAYAMKFFFCNPYESLIIVDKQGKIEFMDKWSEKFFGLSPGGAKGRKVEYFVKDSVFPRVIETGYPSIGRLLQVKNTRKISSTYPLIRNGDVVGAIGRVLFRSLEEVEQIHAEVIRLKREVKTLRERHADQHYAVYNFQDILGKSHAIKDSIEMAKKVALTGMDALIAGESGTGKELFANAIHNISNPEGPFVRVNCPAIPFELAESELFGYEKGAFSGASTSGKLGKFELAHNGTIFLDELSSMPLTIQAKLLRILQEREIEKLGSIKIKKLKFRVIAATNTDLKKEVDNGRFRKDLYYRIAKAAVHIPPLRERKEDIPIYIDHYLRVINKQFGTGFTALSQEALDSFLNYNWPGNVRDLINMLEQACLKEWKGEKIGKHCLPRELCKRSNPRKTSPHSTGFKIGVSTKERMLISQALNNTKGNKRKAASLLKMPRSTFYNKLKRYGL